MSQARVYGNLFSGALGTLVGLLACGLYLHNSSLIESSVAFLIPCFIFRAIIAEKFGE